jgi:hypothetical protein
MLRPFKILRVDLGNLTFGKRYIRHATWWLITPATSAKQIPIRGFAQLRLVEPVVRRLIAY